VLLLVWEHFRLLLPIELDYATLEELQANPTLTPVTALLLAESGYTPVNPAEWIDGLRLQVVLLSVGADDPDSLPSQDTLALLEGYTLLRTDRNGWIELTTDGKRMWVEVKRVERRRDKWYASSTHPTNSDGGFYSPRSSSQLE